MKIPLNVKLLIDFLSSFVNVTKLNIRFTHVDNINLNTLKLQKKKEKNIPN